MALGTRLGPLCLCPMHRSSRGVRCVVCRLLSGGHDARPLHQYEGSRPAMVVSRMSRLWGSLPMATLRLVNDEQLLVGLAVLAAFATPA